MLVIITINTYQRHRYSAFLTRSRLVTGPYVSHLILRVCFCCRSRRQVTDMVFVSIYNLLQQMLCFVYLIAIVIFSPMTHTQANNNWCVRKIIKMSHRSHILLIYDPIEERVTDRRTGSELFKHRCTYQWISYKILSRLFLYSTPPTLLLSSMASTSS